MTSVSLEDKVERLLALEEIRGLSFRYARGQDRLDASLQRSVFHDDAVLEFGYFNGGPDAFVAFAQGVLARHEMNQHLLGQMDVSVEGDRATGEIYTIAYHRLFQDGAPMDLFVAGRYIDTYERRAGVWKICYRAELVDWSRTEPASDSFFTVAASALRGARGQADLSARFRHSG